MEKIEIYNAYTEPIIKYNCDNMCSHENCDKRYTRFIKFTLNKVPVILSLCDEHANEVDSYAEAEAFFALKNKNN